MRTRLARTVAHDRRQALDIVFIGFLDTSFRRSRSKSSASSERPLISFCASIACCLHNSFDAFFRRCERMEVRGKATGTREKIGNLSLKRSVEKVQSIRIGFIDGELRNCESGEFVKMLIGPELHILKLPNLFKALPAIYKSCYSSNER